MSKFDSIWTEHQAAKAKAEGWQLAITIDEGKPITSAYLFIFDDGPRFPGRNAAYQHVLSQAYAGSKLCVDALSACAASRTYTPTKKTAKKKASARV